MADLKVEVDGSGAVIKLENIEDQLPSTIRELVSDSLDFALRKLKGNIPHDTGNLWESREVEKDENSWEVTFTAPYAADVEWPTRASKGRYVPGKYLEKPYYSKKDRYKGEERGIRLKKSNPRAGMHPGTEGVFYRKKTLDTLIDALPEKFQIKINKVARGD